jgi:hypothetical protein
MNSFARREQDRGLNPIVAFSLGSDARRLCTGEPGRNFLGGGSGERATRSLSTCSCAGEGLRFFSRIGQSSVPAGRHGRTPELGVSHNEARMKPSCEALETRRLV